jgi:hypothetical protein
MIASFIVNRYRKHHNAETEVNKAVKGERYRRVHDSDGAPEGSAV